MDFQMNENKDGWASLPSVSYYVSVLSLDTEKTYFYIYLSHHSSNTY